MPNSLAYLVLAVWPLVSLMLFRRLPVGRAIIASILVAYLFLPPQPAGYDFPLLPPLNKDTIPGLVALLLCLILYRPGMDLLPKSKLGRALVALYVLSPVATVLTNGEPVVYIAFALPGLSLREAVGMMIGQVVLIAPFLMARHFLANPEDQKDLILALFIGALVYSPLMLLEVRLSPQLNIWIYGYFQHVFEQMMRGDGFRPIVFLYHGLWVAFFAMTAVLATVALLRQSEGRERLSYAILALYLLGVLILCKSLGSIIYAFAFAPLVLILGARSQIRLAGVLALIALFYPVAKGANVVPDGPILAVAYTIDAERANSLEFRFEQEHILIDRAYEKPLFGWGAWGRHHRHDPISGQILTITDGRWVLVIGTLGWAGFVAEFGLLTLPLLTLLWRARSGVEELPPYIGPLALILGVNVLDLVPNATLTPLTWMIAGAVLGYAERHVRVPAPRPVPLRTVL